jgi:hypothetical protein
MARDTLRRTMRAVKRKKKIPLVLRGQKKWVVRLFNCGCSIVAMRRAGIKAISGYRGVVWQSEPICRHSV